MTAYAIYRARIGSTMMAESTLLVPVERDEADPLTVELASGPNANVWEAELVGAILLSDDPALPQSDEASLTDTIIQSDLAPTEW